MSCHATTTCLWMLFFSFYLFNSQFKHPSKRNKKLHLNWIIFWQNNIFRFGAFAYLPSSLPKNLFDILRFSHENGIRFRHKKLTDKEVKLKMSKKKPQNDLSATFESNKIVDGICVALYACFGKQMPSKFHSWVKWMAPSGFRAKQSQIMCTRFVLAIYTHL